MTEVIDKHFTRGCGFCKDETIPERFIHPYYKQGGYVPACPECVLKDRGEGKFQGREAQNLLTQFRKWKKRRRKND